MIPFVPMETIEILRPKPSPVPLIRIGGDKDGAYLLPDDLQGVKACFSPGVNNRKDFEDELLDRYGIASHMCDYSSDSGKFRTPLKAGQTFKKKWLDVNSTEDNISLEDWVQELAPDVNDDLILQMDIEGAEYRNLLQTPDAILRRFRIIVIELHRLRACSRAGASDQELGPMLARLDGHFLCVHAHPNNCDGDFQLSGSKLNLPNVLEVTFLRKDRWKNVAEEYCYPPMLPHPLDIAANVPQKPPVFLNEHWLTSGERAPESTIKLLTDRINHLSRALRQAQAPSAALKQDVVTNLHRLAQYVATALPALSPKPAAMPLVDLAQGKPFTITSEHAACPKGGRVTEQRPFFFHTREGRNQAITIDLEARCRLFELRIANRTDACQERACCLFYSIHDEPKPNFRQGFPVTLDEGFLTNADHISVTDLRGGLARYLTIFSPGTTFLHLSVVQILGVQVGRETVNEPRPSRIDRHSKENFILLKGLRGWGDRLQCLLQAVRYAKKTGRVLVVDWRDRDWTHDPNESLDKWFRIQGISTMGFAEFAEWFRQRSGRQDVVPASWGDRLLEPGYEKWMYKSTYQHVPNQGVFEEIVRGVPDFRERVVVYPGVGQRTFSYRDVAKIILAPWLEEKIRSAARGQGLFTGRYDVVHLRGGSKAWAGGVVALEELNERIARAWASERAYLEDMFRRYELQPGRHEERELIILTDTRDLGSAWIEVFGKGRMIPTCNEYWEDSGTHKIGPVGLSQIGVSKEQLNIELLRDFCIMLNARCVIGDGISVYSKMGHRCNRAGVRMVEFGESK